MYIPVWIENCTTWRFTCNRLVQDWWQVFPHLQRRIQGRNGNDSPRRFDAWWRPDVPWQPDSYNRESWLHKHIIRNMDWPSLSSTSSQLSIIPGFWVSSKSYLSHVGHNHEERDKQHHIIIINYISISGILSLSLFGIPHIIYHLPNYLSEGILEWHASWHQMSQIQVYR